MTDVPRVAEDDGQLYFYCWRVTWKAFPESSWITDAGPVTEEDDLTIVYWEVPGQ